MKTKLIILLIILLIPIACHAEMDIKLVWEFDTPKLISGYKIYCSNVSGQYDPNKPIDVIEDPNVMVSEITLNDGIWFFVCTAYTDNSETGYSNEVTNMPPPSIKKCFGF